MLHMSIFYKKKSVLLFFSILWPKSQKALPALLLTSVFKVSTESRGDEVHLHCVCESEQKVELKKSQYGTGSINKASTKNSKSAGRAGRTWRESSWVWRQHRDMAGGLKSQKDYSMWQEFIHMTKSKKHDKKISLVSTSTGDANISGVPKLSWSINCLLRQPRGEC